MVYFKYILSFIIFFIHQPVATVNASTVATTQMTTTVTGSTNNAKPVMSNSNKPDGSVQQQQQQQQPQQQPQQQIQAQFGQVSVQCY